MAASSISGASSSRCWCSRSAPACRSTKASSTSPIPNMRCRRWSPMSCLLRRLPARRLVDGRGVQGIPGRQGQARLDRGDPPSKDPPGFIVLLENGAAMAGIVVAAVGLALAQATGDPFYDGAASVVIGIILGITALHPGAMNQRPADRRGGRPRTGRGAPRGCSQEREGVTAVGEVLTVHSAPDQITAMLVGRISTTGSAPRDVELDRRGRAPGGAAIPAGPATLHPPRARSTPGRWPERSAACKPDRAGLSLRHGPIDARRVGPAQRGHPHQHQRRTEAARRGDGLGVRFAASCSATACGKACASTAAGSPSSTAISTALFEGAKALALDIGLTRDELTQRLYETLDANKMDDGVHIRLMVTRGVRSTPYQDPRTIVSRRDRRDRSRI